MTATRPNPQDQACPRPRLPRAPPAQTPPPTRTPAPRAPRHARRPNVHAAPRAQTHHHHYHLPHHSSSPSRARALHHASCTRQITHRAHPFVASSSSPNAPSDDDRRGRRRACERAPCEYTTAARATPSRRTRYARCVVVSRRARAPASWSFKVPRLARAASCDTSGGVHTTTCVIHLLASSLDASDAPAGVARGTRERDARR